MSDFGYVSKQVHSRGYISPIFCRITQTLYNSDGALCFVASVRGCGIFHNHMWKRGSPVQWWEGNTGCVSLYSLRSNTDVHVCHAQGCTYAHKCIYTHTVLLEVGQGGKFWLAAEAGQEVIMVLQNTAVVSTAFPNLCWDIPNFLSKQKCTHKHTTVCIYADEHT